MEYLLTNAVIFYIFFLQSPFDFSVQKSPLILHANCMSFGIMVTHFAWIANIFACLRSPAKNASPASCSGKTAELCNHNPSLLLCTISLTSLWKGTLQINKSAPFWYFWISFRACIPLWIFLCFSIFSSLIIFNCFPFYLLSSVLSVCSPLSIFSSSLVSYYQLPWPFLSLPFLLILLWFLPFLIMEDGPGLVLIVLY